MEKKIIEALDNLTIEQTEMLLDHDIDIRISAKDKKRIKNKVLENAKLKKQKIFYIPKKLVACILAFAIVITSFSVIGFNKVGAAIKNLFTFIPGLGIEEATSDTIFAYEPIKRKIQNGSITANVVRAVYSNGYLNVTVEVNDTDTGEEEKKNETSKMPFYNDFSLFINGQLKDYQSEPSNASLAWSSNSAMLMFSYKTSAPKSDDVYEIGIEGFTEKLAFSMAPCESFEELSKIGSTDIQNGISLTATAERFEDKLVIWCYPFKVTKNNKDMILGYGNSVNGAYAVERYIETENGRLIPDYKGWTVNGRFIYNITDNDTTAVLHIPYLSMLRKEKKKQKISLPKDYSSVDGGATISTSLGDIKVKKVTREENSYQANKDTVKIYFDFDYKDENLRPYSFNFDIDKKLTGAMHFNGETGTLDFIEISVSKSEKSVTLNISDIYYYLFGEYVIPLDIK